MSRYKDFFEKNKPTTPCLIMDISQAKKNLVNLQSLSPRAKIYYAVKANPSANILSCFIEQGAFFDGASINEIKLVLSLGCNPNRICFGNIAKKTEDIKAAYDCGVPLFVADSKEELSKIAKYAPGSKVLIRISANGTNAVFPLSSKFGCEVDTAVTLVLDSVKMGLKPHGISFHVGSQQLNPYDWEEPIREASFIFQEVSRHGITLPVLDLGGGFPIDYQKEVPEIKYFIEVIDKLLETHFSSHTPEIFYEPGRFLVGNAGEIFSQVILTTDRENLEGEKRRWVYLDIGVYGGLPHASDSLIYYNLETCRTGEMVVTSLAGPTCASSDIMYKKDHFLLPCDLQSGDIVRIKNTGAYTFSWSTIGFNGFAPLQVYCIDPE